MTADCKGKQVSALIHELGVLFSTHLHNAFQHEYGEQLSSEPLSLSSIAIQCRDCHQYMVIYRTVSTGYRS